jgi:hypothetical protein
MAPQLQLLLLLLLPPTTPPPLLSWDGAAIAKIISSYNKTDEMHLTYLLHGAESFLRS